MNYVTWPMRCGSAALAGTRSTIEELLVGPSSATSPWLPAYCCHASNPPARALKQPELVTDWEVLDDLEGDAIGIRLRERLSPVRRSDSDVN